MARWAAVAALLAWSFAPPPAVAEEGCPFLSDAEVEELTGRKQFLKLNAMQMPDGSGIVCESPIVTVLVLLGEDSESRWEELLQGAGRAETPRLPVEGLGDNAYALHFEPRTEYEYPTAAVVVTSESFTLGVSVEAEEGKAAETVHAQAVELAGIALSRVTP
jgi:hypothetical protein